MSPSLQDTIFFHNANKISPWNCVTMATRVSALPHRSICWNSHFPLGLRAFVLVIVSRSLLADNTGQPGLSVLASFSSVCCANGFFSEILALNHLWRHFPILDLNIFEYLNVFTLPPPFSFPCFSSTPPAFLLVLLRTELRGLRILNSTVELGVLCSPVLCS